MRMGFTEQRIRGMTRIDVVAVLVAIFVLTILFAIVVPVHDASRRKDALITCIENLRQINVATRIWEGDNSPGAQPLGTKDRTFRFDETNGLNSGQIAWINEMGISNVTHLEKVLHCPADKETPMTTNAAGLKIRISYFLNLDANEGYPQQILSGDDNLAASGIPMKPGVFELSSNTPVSWTAGRHGYVGNIGLADGSVDQTTSFSLQNAAKYSFLGTSFSTNRFAIP